MILDDQIIEQKQSKKRKFPKEDENEPQMIGPNPKKLQKMDYQDLLLEELPATDYYEISYMHRDMVNIVICSSKTNYIVTASIDGHIKFWKKVFSLVEFVKNFKAHNGLITNLSFNKTHQLLCSAGFDKTIKIFDNLNCDLRTVLKLTYIPTCCDFISQNDRDWELIAVSEQKTGRIVIIDPEGSKQTNFDDGQEIMDQKIHQNKQIKETPEKENTVHVVKTLTFHKHPVKAIKMNWDFNICFSIDERSFLQVWDPKTFDFPVSLKYKCKIESEFLQLLQANSSPVSLNLSPKGNLLAVVLKDKIIRIFNVYTGKKIVTLSENIKDVMKIQQDVNHPQHQQFLMSEQQYEKKLNIQKDLQICKEYQFNPNVEFDEGQQYIIFASIHGIKIYSLKKKEVQRIIGLKQGQRYVKIALFQGKTMRNPSGNANATGERKGRDPLIICTAFRKSRFYMFSKREPELQQQKFLQRDIVNEKIIKQQAKQKEKKKMTQKNNEVVLQTTMGDIHLLLYLEDCPKSCQNFIKLVKKGYYNGMIFHRVIKNFMNQTGCPNGNGTGGESIWGGTFQDELRPEKYRFDRPYVLAMANRGANTNGSQFFLTVIACPWLDNKHTIFGRVIKGYETVLEINRLKTDKTEKPLTNVKIMNTRVA